MLGRAAWSSWILYTPTYSTTDGGAIGNGTTSGMWRRLGDSLEFAVRVTFGSTSTFGSGAALRLSLPGTYTRDAAKILSNTGRVVGSAYMRDSSTPANDRPGFASIGSGGDTMVFIADADTGTSVVNTTPFTWADGDQILAWGICPITGF